MKKTKISILLFVLSIAILATLSIIFWQEHQISRDEAEKLKKENEKLQDDYLTLDASLISLNELNVHMSKELEMFRNPANRIFFLSSADLVLEETRSIICWNRKTGAILISVENFPEIPSDKKAILWAEINGKMISLGVLPKGLNSNFIQLEFTATNAENFLISLENSTEKPIAVPQSPYLTGNP